MAALQKAERELAERETNVSQFSKGFAPKIATRRTQSMRRSIFKA